jgi:hypothetical protein
MLQVFVAEYQSRINGIAVARFARIGIDSTQRAVQRRQVFVNRFNL